ncbi:hypothetical protein D9M73_189680 [compost metagenome]
MGRLREVLELMKIQDNDFMICSGIPTVIAQGVQYIGLNITTVGCIMKNGEATATRIA